MGSLVSETEEIFFKLQSACSDPLRRTFSAHSSQHATWQGKGSEWTHSCTGCWVGRRVRPTARGYSHRDSIGASRGGTFDKTWGLRWNTPHAQPKTPTTVLCGELCCQWLLTLQEISQEERNSCFTRTAGFLTAQGVFLALQSTRGHINSEVNHESDEGSRPKKSPIHFFWRYCPTRHVTLALCVFL